MQQPSLNLYLLELATQTAKKFAKENDPLNDTLTTSTIILKYYLYIAATNNKIQDMDLKQALEFLITPNINPHTLARVITFYNIQNQSKFFIKQIQEKYNEKYLPQAEDFIINYDKITTPIANNNSLFFTSNTTNNNTSNNQTNPFFQ
ncbi:40992_t:CDS:2 [Gigaspora margarita]|uniref:40992_t:CDS:1 n=1 Tax=Gigaspora margarita TaxID=4874 RepID=A0ABN7WPS2_GIGMA|nr:40992_t:CDS:2 [Gigaspora margarita]